MRGLFRLAQAEDSDNVGMADLRQRPSLLHKPCAHALDVPVPPVQRLDRHFPPQPLVQAQQNASHAPLPLLPYDVVARQRIGDFFWLFACWLARATQSWAV